MSPHGEPTGLPRVCPGVECGPSRGMPARTSSHPSGDWCNGSTSDSDSLSLGSNPRSPIFRLFPASLARPSHAPTHACGVRNETATHRRGPPLAAGRPLETISDFARRSAHACDRRCLERSVWNSNRIVRTLACMAFSKVDPAADAEALRADRKSMKDKPFCTDRMQDFFGFHAGADLFFRSPLWGRKVALCLVCRRGLLEGRRLTGDADVATVISDEHGRARRARTTPAARRGEALVDF